MSHPLIFFLNYVYFLDNTDNANDQGGSLPGTRRPSPRLHSRARPAQLYRLSGNYRIAKPSFPQSRSRNSEPQQTILLATPAAYIMTCLPLEYIPSSTIYQILLSFYTKPKPSRFLAAKYNKKDLKRERRKQTVF